MTLRCWASSWRRFDRSWCCRQCPAAQEERNFELLAQKHCVMPEDLVCLFVCFCSDSPPPVGHGLLIPEVSRSHTTTHHSQQDSSGRVISPSHRLLPDNTQHSQQTDIRAPGWIRTHNLSRRAAADPRLRPRSHRDRKLRLFCLTKILRCLHFYILQKLFSARKCSSLKQYGCTPVSSIARHQEEHCFVGRLPPFVGSRVQLKCDGTRWRTGGEVKGKPANGVGSQYSSHYLGTWFIQHYYR